MRYIAPKALRLACWPPLEGAQDPKTTSLYSQRVKTVFPGACLPRGRSKTQPPFREVPAPQASLVLRARGWAPRARRKTGGIRPVKMKYLHKLKIK